MTWVSNILWKANSNVHSDKQIKEVVASTNSVAYSSQTYWLEKCFWYLYSLCSSEVCTTQRARNQIKSQKAVSVDLIFVAVRLYVCWVNRLLKRTHKQYILFAKHFSKLVGSGKNLRLQRQNWNGKENHTFVDWSKGHFYASFIHSIIASGHKILSPEVILLLIKSFVRFHCASRVGEHTPYTTLVFIVIITCFFVESQANLCIKGAGFKRKAAVESTICASNIASKRGFASASTCEQCELRCKVAS